MVLGDVAGPVDGFAEGIAMCLSLGYSDEDIRKMTSRNAAALFGIAADVAAARPSA